MGAWGGEGSTSASRHEGGMGAGCCSGGLCLCPDADAGYGGGRRGFPSGASVLLSVQWVLRVLGQGWEGVGCRSSGGRAAYCGIAGWCPQHSASGTRPGGGSRWCGLCNRWAAGGSGLPVSWGALAHPCPSSAPSSSSSTPFPLLWVVSQGGSRVLGWGQAWGSPSPASPSHL